MSEQVVVEAKGKFTKRRMRGHTRKGVLLGGEGGDEGILLFLGRARCRRRDNLGKGFSTNKGEVLLHGELWWGGHREI